MILGAHTMKEYEARFVCPISRTEGELAAILSVDNTDVIHIDMNKQQTAIEVHRDLQASIASWGSLLMANVDALKLIKCFYYLISFNFNWNANGKWSHALTEQNKEFAIGVSTPGEGFKEIDNLDVNIAMKILGIYLCPTGDASAQIKYILGKAFDWVGRAKERNLKRRDIWFILTHQWWPRLVYG